MAQGVRGRSRVRAMRVTAVATAVATWGLAALGSTVRVTNSGMGCPSWPLCYGQLGPIFRFHAILEESHRYTAAIVSVLVFATLFLVLRHSGQRATKVWAKIAAGLVIFQALLGGLTVLAKNAPWTVSVHLVVGLIFLATTTVTAVLAVLGDRFRGLSQAGSTWGIAAIGAFLLVVISGTVTMATDAGLSCTSWPLCAAGSSDLPVVALLHRGVVALSTLLLLGFVYRGWAVGSSQWRRRSWWLLGLLLLVAGVGALVAISKTAPFWADIHLAVAGALWMLLVVQVVTAGSAPRLSGVHSRTAVETSPNGIRP